jgi:RNA polymerase sigma-70 factor (ECF subfamily)
MEPRDGSPAPSDADIIDRIRRGDMQAFGLLVERYERGVLAAVMPAVRDAHVAQDVTQDVFVQCYLKLATLRTTSRFGYWLLTVARREAVRAARQRRRRTGMQLVDAAAATATAPDNGRLFRDERERLLECVQRLPAHERLAVTMRFFDGRSVQEIADITGNPVGTVTKRLSRAIERLRGKLESGKPWPTTNSKSPAS